MARSSIKGRIFIDLDRDIYALNTFINSTLEKYNVSFSDLIELLRKQRQKDQVLLIPLSLFKHRSLGFLEALTKYLKEELNLRYHEIAALLKRDDRLIWTTYNNAQRKYPKHLSKDPSSIKVPIHIFTIRNLGPLESLSLYLKDHLKLTYHEIAKLLARDNRTIWACYHKAKRK